MGFKETGLATGNLTDSFIGDLQDFKGFITRIFTVILKGLK